LKLDAINQVDGYRNMFSTQSVKKWVLQKLAFVVHDILRVRMIKEKEEGTIPQPSATVPSEADKYP
jgi:hypothetical protein